MFKLITFSCALVLFTFSSSTSEAATPNEGRSMVVVANNSGGAKDFEVENQDEMGGGAAVFVAPAAPLADPAGITKNRFISFAITQPGIAALRVTLVSLHHVDPPYTNGPSIPFTHFEGQSLYVGPPIRYIESQASALPFYSSILQCEPYYQDWSTLGMLHVTGEAVVPSSIYDIQSLSGSCRDDEANCEAISIALTLETTRWGDVVDFNDTGSGEGPDFGDIAALVEKFSDGPGAPIKSAALLAGITERGALSPGSDLNMTHIAIAVDAFRGAAYPYKPGKCSNNSARSCISDDECLNDDPTGLCLLCGDVTGGACCHGDGTCDIMPESACDGAQDTYHGDGTPCSRCCGPSSGCLPLTDTEWFKAQQSWPNLNRDDVCKEAEINRLYNCVGWVLGSTNLSIWIGIDAAQDEGIWPLFEFEDFIDPYQKPVIVYGTGNDSVLHASIPLPNNCASSKAGSWIRLRHDRNQLEGGAYGDILATYIY
jgi:hypothetical protein